MAKLKYTWRPEYDAYLKAHYFGGLNRRFQVLNRMVRRQALQYWTGILKCLDLKCFRWKSRASTPRDLLKNEAPGFRKFPQVAEYVRSYHEDRTHLGLGEGTPAGRAPSARRGRILSHPRLGGLHPRYERAA